MKNSENVIKKRTAEKLKTLFKEEISTKKNFAHSRRCTLYDI